MRHFSWGEESSWVASSLPNFAWASPEWALPKDPHLKGSWENYICFPSFSLSSSSACYKTAIVEFMLSTLLIWAHTQEEWGWACRHGKWLWAHTGIFPKALLWLFVLYPEGGIPSYTKRQLLIYVLQKRHSFRKIFKSRALVKSQTCQDLGSKHVAFIHHILQLSVVCITDFKNSEPILSNSCFISE